MALRCASCFGDLESPVGMIATFLVNGVPTVDYYLSLTGKSRI